MAGLGIFPRAAILVASLSFSANAEPRLHLAENEVKAALIYTFLRYTDWPDAGEATPLTVCVWRDDGLDGRLAPIEGRTVNARAIDLRVVENASGLGGCALLYVDADELASWTPLQANAANSPMLTVSDASGFVGSGGMIELSTANNRVEVRLDPRAIAAAHLNLEARLLRLAEASSAQSR